MSQLYFQRVSLLFILFLDLIVVLNLHNISIFSFSMYCLSVYMLIFSSSWGISCYPISSLGEYYVTQPPPLGNITWSNLLPGGRSCDSISSLVEYISLLRIPLCVSVCVCGCARARVWTNLNAYLFYLSYNFANASTRLANSLLLPTAEGYQLLTGPTRFSSLSEKARFSIYYPGIAPFQSIQHVIQFFIYK